MSAAAFPAGLWFKAAINPTEALSKAEKQKIKPRPLHSFVFTAILTGLVAAIFAAWSVKAEPTILGGTVIATWIGVSLLQFLKIILITGTSFGVAKALLGKGSVYQHAFYFSIVVLAWSFVELVGSGLATTRTLPNQLIIPLILAYGAWVLVPAIQKAHGFGIIRAAVTWILATLSSELVFSVARALLKGA